MINSIQLIQPRHIYAPPFDVKKEGHIYLPTSLLSAAARLLDCGVNVSFSDGNLEEIKLTSNVIGLNLLGAPYLPSPMDFIQNLENNFGKDYKLVLGGQIVSGLSRKQITKLYNDKIYNGNNISELASAIEAPERTIKTMEKVSLIQAYNLLADKELKMYLSREFSFYLSQGCKHSCSFCSASRSTFDPLSGKFMRVKEIYRDIDIALSDLNYLIQRAKKLGITSLKLYLSNLDLFQTPIFLLDFAIGVKQLLKTNPTISLKFRGLSTCRSFLITHEKFPHIIRELVEIGLYQIGFGIDGATPKVYKETRKPQNVKESLSSIEICQKEYNITPESLMVFGHNNKEDEDSLVLALKFCEDMQIKYGALPRPHVAKDIVPGNDGWENSSNRHIIDKLISNPILFQNLDFTAAPSKLTHSNSEFRNLVNKYYIKVCDLPNSLTQYVRPYELNMTKEEENVVYNHNLERYDI